MREVRELGLRGTAFRLQWELRNRVAPWQPASGPGAVSAEAAAGSGWATRLPWPEPSRIAAALRDSIAPQDLRALAERAARASAGVIRCFGRWEADFGSPVDWYTDPRSGYRRDPGLPWPRALAQGEGVSDVKMVWEAARFPHAYEMARAAAFFPASREALAAALAGQIRGFRRAVLYPRGVHWASGQEVVFRLTAWLFAFRTLLAESRASAEGAEVIAREMVEALQYVDANIDYARHAVYNNHLLSEALGLYAGGVLLGDIAGARRLKERGRELLDEGVRRQFYGDGAYIQLSHNYHRVALQDLLLALGFSRSAGEEFPEAWRAALGRSVDFLVAHQNPADGSLPNFGANDGALPFLLSTCDFSDFRPTLQAASIAARGERLYEVGPWDEEAAWLLGPDALDARVAPGSRRSVSFSETGFHVLRSDKDEGTFAAFRCGTIRDRFSQIDMLHVDLIWKGLNVLADGGSFLYNGPREWHDYFMRTASHNTVTVDGHDQMKHARKFKCLYWTEAMLLAFERRGSFTVAAGEHYGFRRLEGRCVHRRAMALHDDGIGVVVDTVTGEGTHRARLHWLMGAFPHEVDLETSRVRLDTPSGPFELAVLGPGLGPGDLDVVVGAEHPPRGWLSRYYGEKIPVASVAVESAATLPLRFVTVFGPGPLEHSADGTSLLVRAPSGELRLGIDGDGLLSVN